MKLLLTKHGFLEAKSKVKTENISEYFPRAGVLLEWVSVYM